MPGVRPSLFQKHGGALLPLPAAHPCSRPVLSTVLRWSVRALRYFGSAEEGHPSPSACSCSGPGPALTTVLWWPAHALRCCSSAEGDTPPLLLKPLPVRAQVWPPPQASAASHEPPSDPGCTPHSASAPAAGPVESGRLRPTHKERIPSYRCLVTRSHCRAQSRSTAQSGLLARVFQRPFQAPASAPATGPTTSHARVLLMSGMGLHASLLGSAPPDTDIRSRCV
ncbi:hypothetical protein NDU88_004958 [Pleurodeles waltl]|uniref:Uncharacterized protein n=1 Tax=Pleurodeles waltl TaxID=8319 RepID=A0AAV7RH48_PLEWA|nr:hypothetical protein NDU88_004958 [Pleurodeles waltl]